MESTITWLVVEAAKWMKMFLAMNGIGVVPELLRCPVKRAWVPREAQISAIWSWVGRFYRGTFSRSDPSMRRRSLRLVLCWPSHLLRGEFFFILSETVLRATLTSTPWSILILHDLTHIVWNDQYAYNGSVEWVINPMSSTPWSSFWTVLNSWTTANFLVESTDV